MKYFLKHYWFSMIITGIIWYLSFFTPPKTDLDEIPLVDKWVHIVMYGGLCTSIWIEYMRFHECIRWKKMIVGAIICPIAMSGIIELLQEYCTNHRRSGDVKDLLANSIGVLLIAGICYIKLRFFPQKP